MRILQAVVSFFSLFVAGMLPPAVGADSSGSTLAAQAVAIPNAASIVAAQRELRVRFQRLWRRTATIHTGWERGLWLRGALLADDYAHRAALVRFLRTELVPYLTAIADSHVIEGIVERLDAAARSLGANDFHNNAFALSVVVDNYFAKDNRGIQQIGAREPGY